MNTEESTKTEVYRFGDCELDADRRELRVAGTAVTTQPKAFDLLLYLIRNRSRAIDKDELQDKLWPRTIVTETALTRCVMKARRAVNDDADTQAIIKTVHGHGYRFIAEMRDAGPSQPDPEAVPVAARGPAGGHLVAIGAALVVGIAALWWYLAPPAVSDTIRVAVLPIENASGDDELDWARKGLMALMNRMLEDEGVTVVGGNSVSSLAGERPVSELLQDGSEFRQALKQTTAATHLVGATLDTDGELYRLSYVFTGGERPERRTVIGQEPAGLIKEAAATLATFFTKGPPKLERMSFVSNDDFLNEAYARAMSLQFEGRYEEAQRLFQVIVEQQPELFWPRYEYALAARNLRDYENAERLFIELRDETRQKGQRKQEAAVHNSLGIMYMNRRRNEDALNELQAVLQIAEDEQEFYYLAVAHENLGLLAKNTGDLPLALMHMKKAEENYGKLDIGSMSGSLHNNMSGVLILLGNLDEAELHSYAAIENFRLTGKRLFESYALSRLASIQRRNGMLEDAEETAQRAMSVRVELGDRRGTAASLLTLSDISHDRGDLTRAHQYALQARDIGAEIDDQDVTVDALLTIANAELALDRPQDAAANYAAAEAISRNNGDRINEFGARYGVARSWIAIGDYNSARAIADQLIAESQQSDREREESAGYNLYADIHMARSEWSEAIASLVRVLRLAQAIGDTNLAASAHARLGRCWLELGDAETAVSHVDRAAAQRPANADLLRLQARLAAANGNADAAVRLMTDARLLAGEGWQESDDALLEDYRTRLPKPSQTSTSP